MISVLALNNITSFNKMYIQNTWKKKSWQNLRNKEKQDDLRLLEI